MLPAVNYHGIREQRKETSSDVWSNTILKEGSRAALAATDPVGAALIIFPVGLHPDPTTVSPVMFSRLGPSRWTWIATVGPTVHIRLVTPVSIQSIRPLRL